MWRRSKRKPAIGRPAPPPLDKLITVGVCAMDKKVWLQHSATAPQTCRVLWVSQSIFAVQTGSKAMKEILKRLGDLAGSELQVRFVLCRVLRMILDRFALSCLFCCTHRTWRPGCRA